MNFRRRRGREHSGARRNDWGSWRAGGVLKRLARQSGLAPRGEQPPGRSDIQKAIEQEVAIWDHYLRDNFGEEEWQ